ncbi:hypothetical protein J2T17_007106 [Paenibacillus mucilaginosus]|uniref:hypothetical protein n=1 Tax=Paenibacillus mucilaginosus TaxID=61624 RepID=UPI003D1A1BDE
MNKSITSDTAREFVVISLSLENRPSKREDGMLETEMEMCFGAHDEPVNFIPFFLRAQQAVLN